MIEEPIIVQSDAVSRYYTRFSVGCLAGVLKDVGDIGRPYLIGHDRTRPVGWMFPRTLHIQSGRAQLVGIAAVAETTDDLQRLRAARHRYFQHLTTEHREEISTLKELLAEVLNGDERPVITESLALVSDGLAERFAPSLFEDLDRDGLISLNRLRPIGPGVFRVGQFLVFAHRGMRRAGAPVNSLNAPLLGRLQDIARKGVTVRIRLDPDMVGLASSYRKYFEYAYWWGPQFDDNVTAIPLGVTRHEASEQERLLHGVSRTEFWWHRQDDQPTLEVEEVRDIPSIAGTGDIYECRYAHAIVDNESGSVVHFDGAIRAYPEELMIERVDSSMDRFGRRSDYTKLWRFDSPISIVSFKQLLSDHFRDNMLVGEYLGATQESMEGFDWTDESRHQSHLFPYSFDRGEGLQIAISLNPAPTTTPASREVVPLDRFIHESGNHEYVHSEIVELRKALRRRGADLEIPSSSLVVTRKDLYKSLPLIIHPPDTTDEDMEVTFQAIEDLVDAWNRRRFDLVATFSLGFIVGEHELRISVMGHCDDLARWLSCPLSRPPLDLERLEDWSDQTANHMSQYFSPPPNSFSLFDTLRNTGVFVLDHHVVDPKEFSIELVTNDSGRYYSVSSRHDRLTQGPRFDQSHLYVSEFFSVEQSSCSKCGSEYMDCEHSKMLDDGVVQAIEQVGVCGLIWTDRPIV